METSASQCIELLISYFKDTLVGVKRVEYAIWARSYRKYKYNYAILHRIQLFMRQPSVPRGGTRRLRLVEDDSYKIRNYHKIGNQSK